MTEWRAYPADPRYEVSTDGQVRLSGHKPRRPSIAALVALFGAPPDEIEVSSLDHLCTTLTPHHVELLLIAGGRRWTKIIDVIDAKRAVAKAAKDPGEDVRNREEKAKGSA